LKKYPNSIVASRFYRRIAAPFILLLLITYYARAQETAGYDTGHIYSVNELKADFNYARTLLQKAHPSYHRYLSKDSADYYFSQAAAQITHPMAALEFWRLLQYPVVKLRSGHTQVGLPKNYIDWLNTHTEQFIPLSMSISNGHVFIKNHARADTMLHNGDELLSVNGQPVQQLISQLRNYAAGDGFNAGLKDYIIEGPYNRLYNWVYPQVTNYRLSYSTAGVVKNITLPPMPLYKERTRGTGPLTGTLTGLLGYNIYYPADMPSTAVLQINHFMYPNYEQIHRDLFKKLKKDKITNLVIDIRNNGGGLDRICTDLLQYLIAKPFMYIYKTERMVDDVRFMNDLAKYNQSQNTADMDKLIANIPDNDRTITNGRTIYTDRSVYKGKVYLLVNQGTFSAAVLFAVTLKLFGKCVVTGSETGGGLLGCDGGAIPSITLPNTKLQLHLPLFFGNSMVKANDSGLGLFPDVPVAETTTRDYSSDDPVLLKVKQMILTGEQ
jgi:hypothetical protein